MGWKGSWERPEHHARAAKLSRYVASEIVGWQISRLLRWPAAVVEEERNSRRAISLGKLSGLGRTDAGIGKGRPIHFFFGIGDGLPFSQSG